MNNKNDSRAESTMSWPLPPNESIMFPQSSEKDGKAPPIIIEATVPKPISK